MRFKKVALGGTFETLHKGHKVLIEEAFAKGDFISMGLTSNKMLEKDASPYEARNARLKNYLEDQGYGDFEIIKLKDKYGPAAHDEEIQAIIVSNETLPNAKGINKIRMSNNLAPLEIIIIPVVLADDNRPISSTRIKKREIDEDGGIL